MGNKYFIALILLIVLIIIGASLWYLFTSPGIPRASFPKPPRIVDNKFGAYSGIALSTLSTLSLFLLLLSYDQYYKDNVDNEKQNIEYRK